jgi:formylglycine-generating enzyme required for sulfatase activity
VYCGALVTLRCDIPSDWPQGTRICWEADDGLLHSDDLFEVQWRAPRTPVSSRIRIALSDGPPALPGGDGRKLHLSLTVQVHPPSTEGMVWIPAGPFLRGDTLNTQNTREVKTIQNSGDEPAHRVHVDGFWIDRHLVTNLDYKRYLDDALEQGLIRVTPVAVMGTFEGAEVPFYYLDSIEKLFPAHFRRFNARKPEFLHWIAWDGSEFHIDRGKEKHPVVDVSWFGAAAYARFHGRKLPTEAQWEKAARGTDGRRFPWGDNVPSARHIHLDHRHGGHTVPVGRFSPAGDSPYGVADMVSGCFEWTRDWFNPHYYADTADAVPFCNPQGPFWGRTHAIRGFPSVLHSPKASLESIEPVSTRYSWHFEFLMGDSFANSETAFRTVLEPLRDDP